MNLGIDLMAPQADGSQPIEVDHATPTAIAPTGQSLAGSDIVHAAMGEQLLAMLAPHGIPCGVDEPWQHYRFSGRADILAWHLPHRALLHVENRTRFPDVQDAIGRFNGKRAYLAGSSWERLGMNGPPKAETHVMLALWSLEVLDTLRAFPGTFGAVCPDPPDVFLAWLAGRLPTTGVTSSLVLFDPFAMGSQVRFASLREALADAKPRVAGYAAAAELLRGRPVRHRTPRDRRNAGPDTA